MKVFVTGAGALLGQGVIRSLRESRLDVQILAADPSPLSVGLYWADKPFLLPVAKDPTYFDRVVDILETERPDAVLVGTDVELHLFAKHREALERTYGCKVVVSSPEVVQIADDKYETYQFFRDAGFDHPDSALPDEVDALIGRVGFPLVVKPRVGARSIGVHRVRDRAELARALGDVEGAVVQEVAGPDSEEYTAGVVCFDGRALASIVMRRDLRDGNTYRAYVDDYPALNAMVRRMGEALRPHGPANFQFRLAGDRVKVFEINARFSGTTPFRMLAGFNEVEMVLRHLLLGETITQPTVEPMIILRYWTEQVVRPGSLVRP